MTPLGSRSEQISRTADKVERQHPDWSRTACLSLAEQKVPPKDHPSPKPVPLMADLLAVVTAPGDLVLDPFAGGGATLVAAKNTGRRAIGIESSIDHCRTIAARLGSIEHSTEHDGSLFAPTS